MWSLVHMHLSVATVSQLECNSLLKQVLLKWKQNEFTFGDDSEPFSGITYNRRTRLGTPPLGQAIIRGGVRVVESSCGGGRVPPARTHARQLRTPSWTGSSSPSTDREGRASWKCRARAVWKECHKSCLSLLLLSILDLYFLFLDRWQ